jgi:hypothetical protein
VHKTRTAIDPLKCVYVIRGEHGSRMERKKSRTNKTGRFDLSVALAGANTLMNKPIEIVSETSRIREFDGRTVLAVWERCEERRLLLDDRNCDGRKVRRGIDRAVLLQARKTKGGRIDLACVWCVWLREAEAQVTSAACAVR